MTKHDLLTYFIFTLFVAVPFISAYVDYKMDQLKQFINRKLAPHGLRLRQRG